MVPQKAAEEVDTLEAHNAAVVHAEAISTAM